MAEPSFRRARKVDEEAIRELIFSILDEYDLKAAHETTDADLFDIDGFYAGGAFELLVDGTDALMGTFGLKRLDGNACELRKMYLDRKHRGHGYGKLLLNRAVARARTLGFTRIELETASVLKEAISLYEAYGFAPIERSCCTGRCDRAYALDL